jgi:hypothetical protein
VGTVEHPSGVKVDDIAEYMGFNLGTAFVALWEGELERALHYIERYDSQRGPIPHMPGCEFRAVIDSRKMIFNRPSPWCESVRYAMAAICDLCANHIIVERSRLTLRIIQCVKTAIDDQECMGRQLEA